MTCLCARAQVTSSDLRTCYGKLCVLSTIYNVRATCDANVARMLQFSARSFRCITGSLCCGVSHTRTMRCAGQAPRGSPTPPQINGTPDIAVGTSSSQAAAPAQEQSDSTGSGIPPSTTVAIAVPIVSITLLATAALVVVLALRRRRQMARPEDSAKRGRGGTLAIATATATTTSSGESQLQRPLVSVRQHTTSTRSTRGLTVRAAELPATLGVLLMPCTLQCTHVGGCT